MACLRPADDPFSVRMGYVAHAIRTLATARIARSIPGTVGTRLPASCCPGDSAAAETRVISGWSAESRSSMSATWRLASGVGASATQTMASTPGPRRG